MEVLSFIGSVFSTHLVVKRTEQDIDKLYRPVYLPCSLKVAGLASFPVLIGQPQGCLLNMMLQTQVYLKDDIYKRILFATNG